MQPIRVALAQDHELVVQGLADTLRDLPGIQFVSFDGNRAPARVDIMLFDPHQPGGGEDLSRLLLRGRFGKLVVYTWTVDSAPVELAKRAGVHGYLSKHMTSGELVDSLRRIHQGEQVFPCIFEDVPLRRVGTSPQSPTGPSR